MSVADDAYLQLGTTQIPWMTEHARRAPLLSATSSCLHLIIWFLPTFWGAMRALSPRVSDLSCPPEMGISLVPLRLTALSGKGTNVQARSDSALKASAGCSKLPNVWFSTLVHIR